MGRSKNSELFPGYATDITPTVRSLPYYGKSFFPGEQELGAALRKDTVTLVARRLPWHHLRGLPHGSVPRFVETYRKAWPVFLRTDIASFYPSIRHRDLVVGVQLAYRDLLGLSYEPSGFKRRYLVPLTRWCEALPLRRGIPLGSPVSAIAAPLMLTPLWLELRRRFGTPLMVCMDDVLVCCRDEAQCAEVFALLENRLHDDYGLSLHPGKTVSGRFGSGRFDFCGWRLAGGYARIADDKAEAFGERIARVALSRQSLPPRALVKRINRLVDAFGHYYKHGNVKRQFEALDIRVRSVLRRCLRGAGRRRIGNEELASLGLHSLTDIRVRWQERQTPASSRRALRRAEPPARDVPRSDSRDDIAAALECIDGKLTQLIRLQRSLLTLLGDTLRNY